MTHRSVADIEVDLIAAMQSERAAYGTVEELEKAYSDARLMHIECMSQQSKFRDELMRAIANKAGLVSS